jgi:hypothetical protein
MCSVVRDEGDTTVAEHDFSDDDLADSDPLPQPTGGPMARLLRAEGGTGPFLLALAGAAAYAGALALDWATVEVPVAVNASSYGTPTQIVEFPSSQVLHISAAGSSASLAFTASNNLTTVDVLGLLFGLGGLVLLTLAGAVLSRPELAVRHRLAACGLGLGLLGVVGAGLARLPTLLLSASQSTSFSIANDQHTVMYQPGIICAVLAIVLPLAAIWLRSRWPEAATAAADDLADDLAAGEFDTAEPPVGPAPRRRTGSWAAGPRPAEPYDLTVTPEP